MAAVATWNSIEARNLADSSVRASFGIGGSEADSTEAELMRAYEREQRQWARDAFWRELKDI
jgi:hypothetical protein